MADALPRGNRSFQGASLPNALRKHPVLMFGLPMVGLLVGGSFALAKLTQTKVDYNSSKVQKLSADEKLAIMGAKKKNFDLREEYFRLQSGLTIDDYEMKPVAKMPANYIPPSPGEMEEILLAESTSTAEPKPKHIVRW